jgi:hypothetical protein
MVYKEAPSLEPRRKIKNYLGKSFPLGILTRVRRSENLPVTEYNFPCYLGLAKGIHRHF